MGYRRRECYSSRPVSPFYPSTSPQLFYLEEQRRLRIHELVTLIQKIYRGWRCRTSYQLMRKSQILISSWFRGNMVPVTPKVPPPHSNRVGNGRGGSGDGVFLIGSLFSTAKEALWKDKGVSIADPGFCERVEGNGEGERGCFPTCGSFSQMVPPVLFQLQLAGGGRAGWGEQLKASPAHTQDIPQCDGTSVSRRVSGPASRVSGSVDTCWGDLYIRLGVSLTWQRSSAICFECPHCQLV